MLPALPGWRIPRPCRKNHRDSRLRRPLPKPWRSAASWDGRPRGPMPRRPDPESPRVRRIETATIFRCESLPVVSYLVLSPAGQAGDVSISQEVKMTRRDFMGCTGSTALLAAGHAAPQPDTPPPNTPPPNIVIMNANDLGCGDTSCYGAERVH